MFILNYRDDERVTEQNFIISEVTAEFLKSHGINQTVEQFKNNVRNCKRYFVVETGNSTKAIQHTKVYDIRDFTEGQDYTKTYRISMRIEERPEILEKFEKFLNFLEKMNFLKILSISKIYQNRNSVFARKYYTLEFAEVIENEN